MEFTKEEKIKILSKNGYESEIGYIFPNPTSQDYDQHFCSKEDADKVIEKGAVTYFWWESAEEMIDLDSAWENFLDYFWDEYTGTEEDIDKALRKEFLE
jgi:hypothetical protein